MFKNITDFLFDSLGAIVFIVAISLFFIINSITNENISMVKDNLMNDKSLHQNKTEVKEPVVSGAEIINKIYIGLETDIMINSYLVRKTVDNVSFDYSLIDFKDNYKVSYQLNTKGEVVLVTYTKV